ncbi:hypothetical protein CPB86DRAFT_496773 [Serendipita vermifera]|nr:hypothetical protein CPB86DRAFT_496773 [Serendipita vermifera]
MRIKHTVSPTSERASCHVWSVQKEDPRDDYVLTQLTLFQLAAKRTRRSFKLGIHLLLRSNVNPALGFTFVSLSEVRNLASKLVKSSRLLNLKLQFACLRLGESKNVAKHARLTLTQGSGAALVLKSVRRSLLRHDKYPTMIPFSRNMTPFGMVIYCFLDFTLIENKPVSRPKLSRHFCIAPPTCIV